MKYKFKTAILAIVAVLISGCASDYLDTLPSSTIGTPVVFETTENAQLAINGMAKLMTRQYLSAQGYNGEGTIKLYYGYPTDQLHLVHSISFHELCHKKT